MRASIEALAADPGLAGAVIVLTSRATALEGGRAWGGWRTVALRYLEEPVQHELVRRLLGGDVDEARRFWTEMGDRPGVAVLLRNPFLLTLAVGLSLRGVEQGEDAPMNRGALLQRALDDCLARGWAPRGTPVPDRWSPVGARCVLRGLSLELHRAGGEAWTPERLSRVLLGLHKRVPAVGEILGRGGSIWESERVFLEDMQHYGGVLGPLDGPALPWRYLHRSLREMLCAECLALELDASAQAEVIEALLAPVAAGRSKKDEDEGPGRSAELISMLAGLVGREEATRWLGRLVEVAPTRRPGRCRGWRGWRRGPTWLWRWR